MAILHLQNHSVWVDLYFLLRDTDAQPGSITARGRVKDSMAPIFTRGTSRFLSRMTLHVCTVVVLSVLRSMKNPRGSTRIMP